MDDEAKELAKVGMEVAMKPFTDLVADVIGVSGGDKLHEFREYKKAMRAEHQAAIGAQAAKLLAARKATPDTDTNPGKIEEILEAAQDETDAGLQKLYAALLAAVVDPSRSSLYRREFVAIVKEMEPIDAVVLKKLRDPAQLLPTRRMYIANETRRQEFEIQSAFDNLERLQLIGSAQSQTVHTPLLSMKGHQFLATVAD